MLDQARLKESIAQYKQNFDAAHWANEKHKWEAVKCFQDNWNVNHPDFADMLSRALAKTGNLLASLNHYPAKMLLDFAKVAPEYVRAMFIDLFDEDKDYFARIERFKQTADELLQRHGNGAGMHYQNENSISAYLWLRFPNKCYIYKFKEVKAVASKLGSNYAFKKGAYAENIRNFLKLYDEIRAELQKDAELVELLQTHLTQDTYADPYLCTLTIDVGYWISNTLAEWEPIDYTPGLTVEQWVSLIQDSSVFHTTSLQIMQRMLDIGGEATCTQLAKQFGETKNFYNVGSSSLAKRIAEKTGCPVYGTEDDSNSWWPILYVGKKAAKDDVGSYIWKLRDELREALGQVDFTHLIDSTSFEPYTKQDFLSEVYMTEDKYDRLTSVLQNKKNIILQGAPGVGKTFAARRLAYSMMGEKDDSRIGFVQFHQNYSYEDFMMGYKPVDSGFELKYGIFHQFCKQAENRPDKDFFFIIDEINRGNMSKIFGELLMLIERGYRGTKATLAYNGMSFTVPENVHLIGMMNTADRSLAMIDYALRRRFSFISMEPGFDSEGFIVYQNALENDTFNALITQIVDLNKEIVGDKSLGAGFCIGHSYFCGAQVCTDEWMKEIVDYDILPMLAEYWFDEPAKVQRWENRLQGVFQ